MRKPHRLLGNILHGRRPDRASQHAAVAAALLNFIPGMDPEALLAGYRVTYWRFLGKTFFRTPRHIGLAVTLAIMGHHFFTLTRRLESGIPRRDATS